MTPPGMIQRVETNTFDERVEILSTELELAFKWDRSSALLAVYSSEYVRADAETALENFLVQQEQKIIRIQMDDAPDFNLISLLQQHPIPANHIFFISGINPGQKNIFSELGAFKDVLIEKKIRIIFWLTQNNVAGMLRAAPDFWGYRQRIIEFGDPPKPDQILQNAIESVWQGIGEYTEQFEDTEEKINLRETFLTELPRNAESTSTRAKLLLTLGILNWRKGDYEKASENLQNALKAAIKLEDNFFEAECFNAIALVNFSQGRNDEAISAYKQAIAIAPDQIFVWNNLGNLCMKIMRYDEAMLAFQKTLKHNDRDPVAWNGLGAVYYALGYLDDSISAYRKAIEYAPALAHPWNGLGDAYNNAGRELDAVAAYQKAIELNKQFITPWLRLAEIYDRLGRNKDAIKSFQRALNINPNDHQIWNDLGLTLLKINSNEEAIQAFTKASKLNRGFGWAYCNLAIAYANQDRYSEAIELCHKSLSIFTENTDKAVAWDRLASYYRVLNDYDNAVRAYQMADKLNGRNAATPQQAASDSPKPAPASPTEYLVEVAPIKKTEGPATVSEAKSIVNTQQNFQVVPEWIFQAESWNENTTVLTNCSQEFSRNKESTDSPNEEKKITDQSTEEPDMSTFFSHPILKTTSASDVSKKLLKPVSFENEDDMAESKNPAVWNEKGNIHFRKGSYTDAAIAYNKAIELDRSFGWPYSNLALTYLTLGKYAEAILLYQKSICLLHTNEEKAASWNSLGNIYRHLNNYEEALNAYQNADEVDPQNAGRRDKADFAYSEPNSQNAQVWIELGNLFFKAASYNDAVDAYTKAVKIDPASGWAYSNLAMSLVFQGKYKESIPVYLKSIDLFTSNKDKAISWNRLGNVYRRMNDSDNAKKAYKSAVNLSDEKESLLTRTRFSLLGNCYSN